MFYGEFWEILGPPISKTPASVYFSVRFLNNLDETATYPDEEDTDLLDESDNEFSCSDDDSETECY